MSNLDRRVFAEAYEATIVQNAFFEGAQYYRTFKGRYFKTMQYILRATGGRPPQRLLEIGGGQISLLFNRIYGTRCTLLDVSDEYAVSVTQHGIEFAACDLLRDDVASKVRDGRFDLIVFCEVVEHLLVPLHSVLRQFVERLDIDGTLFLTTPNFNRLRNCIRILTGQRIVCDWFYPARGRSTGHVLEFENSHLRWQLRQSGLEHVTVDYAQLSNAGNSVSARVMRMFASPLLLRKRWRDNLIAFGRRQQALPAGVSDAGRPAIKLPESGSQLVPMD
jgi:2-polyprenyl-3-methyl-5-hydroxy-6-metoxy-1,4-benzoquinol methylase